MLVGDLGDSNDSDPPFYGNQHSLQRKLSNSEPVCAGLCLVGVVRRRLVAPPRPAVYSVVWYCVVLCGTVWRSHARYIDLPRTREPDSLSPPPGAPSSSWG